MNVDNLNKLITLVDGVIASGEKVYPVFNTLWNGPEKLSYFLTEIGRSSMWLSEEGHSATVAGFPSINYGIITGYHAVAKWLEISDETVRDIFSWKCDSPDDENWIHPIYKVSKLQMTPQLFKTTLEIVQATGELGLIKNNKGI